MQVGGNIVDSWIANYFLKATSIEESMTKDIQWLLRRQCRQAKERLSFQDSAEIVVTDPDTGKAFSLELTRDKFIEILEDNEFLQK